MGEDAYWCWGNQQVEVVRSNEIMTSLFLTLKRKSCEVQFWNIATKIVEEHSRIILNSNDINYVCVKHDKIAIAFTTIDKRTYRVNTYSRISSIWKELFFFGPQMHTVSVMAYS